MILTLRPSKTFLFGLLERELRSRRGAFGLDAAAAHMKNRWMFKTDTYIALDLNETALAEGVRRAGTDPHVRALHADLTKSVPLPTGACDAVVSTNTLSNFSGATRTHVVRELTRLTAPDGLLLCEQPVDDGATVRALHEGFRNIRTIYFKNAISRAYERFFERDGYLGSHPIAGRRPFLWLVWLISRLEYFTCRFPDGNRHVLYVCQEKLDTTREPMPDQP